MVVLMVLMVLQGGEEIFPSHMWLTARRSVTTTFISLHLARYSLIKDSTFKKSAQSPAELHRVRTEPEPRGTNTLQSS